jgi:septum site-determining protein MinC
MADQHISIKGTAEGLLVTIDPSGDWNKLVETLAKRIDQKSGFFAGAQVTLKVGARPLSKPELGTLKAMLERRGLTLAAVAGDSVTTLDAADSLDLRISTNTDLLSEQTDEDDAPINPEEDGTVGVMLRRTLRSGRVVRSEGHVVVYGDVNPGAEIIAGGDIIVWGRLRGKVHAGAYGDEQAVICALDMVPTQLRIAGYIVTSPPDKRRERRPEVALIRNDQIMVETWR